MKKMKAKQAAGVKKALEDYLASQYTTSTVDEGPMEMPSNEPRLAESQPSDSSIWLLIEWTLQHVKKALEDYLASQYTTSTVDEGPMEMPSNEPRLAESQPSDSSKQSSSSGALTPSAPSTPAPKDTGQ
ncbi:hypothetical protein OSTOST_07680 [Ostertagia ostertagi]